MPGFIANISSVPHPVRLFTIKLQVGTFFFPSARRRLDSLTCIPIDLVSHHVHLLLVVRTTKQLRVFNYILIAGAQSYAAHHADETLFVENALARAHYQFTGRDVITATTATTVNTPETESINALLFIYTFRP